MYIEYFCMLIVQVQFAFISAFPILGDLVSWTLLAVSRNGPNFGLLMQLFSVYRVLLTVVFKFSLGSVCAFPVFAWPCIYFSLKYSGIFVLLSLYLTGILLSSKWPSRTPSPWASCWSFGALSSRWPLHVGFRKQLVTKWNGVKFGTQRHQ